MKQFTQLKKLAAGDQVAVISPSHGLPQIFPAPFELGLKRLEEEFGLKPKEYATTRVMGAPLKDRARDIMAAFADDENKAVIASIGGEDQLQLIKYLDKQVFTDNPKPFLGFSDNTHLHNYLWQLGIPSFYGGGVMNQFGMNVAMHEKTINSIKQVLFTGGEYEVTPSDMYNDIGLDWHDPANLNKERLLEENEGHFWDGEGTIEGILWGGCVESLVFQVSAGVHLPDDDDLDGTVLFLETAEDIPEHWIISYLLKGFGERGWLDRFQAIIVGRPKAWEFDKQNTTEQKTAYRKDQRQAVIDAVRQYDKAIPIIQNLDFGHTDPQILIPNGGTIKIDSSKQLITVTY